MNTLNVIKDANRFLSFYTRKKRKYLRINETMQCLYAWRTPIRPYAFIRVHNEIKTIDSCFKSILPVVKGGVIGFNSCTDGTKEYILAFCEKHPQFIPVEYPYDIIPACDFQYKNEELDYNICLDTYYNFVWDKLPKNEWVVKIDADHVFIPEYFSNLCRLPLRKEDCVILNRMNLHCHEGVCYLDASNPFCEIGDSWIIFNDHHVPKFSLDRGWENGAFYAWEMLSLPRRSRFIYGVLSNWHFPRVKNHRNTFNPEQWIKMQDFNFQDYFIKMDMQGRIPTEMLDEEKILSAFNTFNLTGSPILP